MMNSHSAHQSERQPWAFVLCQPASLFALMILVVNDHLLKGSGVLPAWLTGKLSDVAGLYVFPLFLISVVRGLTLICRVPLPRYRGWLSMSMVALTGLIFSLAKTSPSFNIWWADLWGHMVLDSTDLYALPALALSAHKLYTAESRSTALYRNSLQFAVLMAAAWASAATSPPHFRHAPRHLVKTLNCAEHDLQISRLSLQRQRGDYLVGSCHGQLSVIYFTGTRWRPSTQNILIKSLQSRPEFKPCVHERYRVRSVRGDYESRGWTVRLMCISDDYPRDFTFDGRAWSSTVDVPRD